MDDGRLARMYKALYGKPIDHGLDLESWTVSGVATQYGRRAVEMSLSESGELQAVESVGWSFTEPSRVLGPARTQDVEPVRSFELNALRTVEEGWGGTDYDDSGRKSRALGDHPVKDVTVKWRGLMRDHGEAERLYKSSTVYQRAVNDHINGLRNAPWRGMVPDDCPEEFEEECKRQAELVTRVIRELEGGWKKFVNEAVKALLVQGFGLWQRIHHADGRLRKLAFRHSWTLDGLALNEEETEILAFRFLDSHGTEYIVDARDMLVISFQAEGLDIEGLSPWRAGCEYERASQMLLELFMVSAEKHGAPRDIAEQAIGADMTDEDKQSVTRALDYQRADDMYSLVSPPGVSIKTLSPSGAMPDFMTMIRYCDEQKVLPLSSEGALFTGQSAHGSHAMVEVKDEQSSASVVSLGELIADALNGADNQSFTGPLKAMIDAIGGPPAPGLYPVLGFVEKHDQAELSEILAGVQAGVVDATDEVIGEIHRRLRLPVPVLEEKLQGAEPAVRAAEISNMDVAAAESCGCGPVDLKFAENAFGRQIDPTEAVDTQDKTNHRIGKIFAGIAKKMRSDWVERTAGVGAAALIGIREAMRQRWLAEFRGAAQFEIDALRVKGGLGVARELGIVDKVPAKIQSAETTTKTLQIADALALKSYNITESYLLQRSQLEANGLPEKVFPDVPSDDAYTSHARSMTAPAYTAGRNEFVEEVKAAAGRVGPGGGDPRIVAEYSSVLESSTCDPCAALDGRRFFVGSSEYEKYKPVSVCEGGNRCRCIMTYLADEQDLEQIKAELRKGFSQSGNDVAFSDGGLRWGAGLLLFRQAYNRGQ